MSARCHSDNCLALSLLNAAGIDWGKSFELDQPLDANFRPNLEHILEIAPVARRGTHRGPVIAGELAVDRLGYFV